MPSPALKDYLDKMYYCMRCGFCRFACTTLSQRDMEETFSPRGRILLIRGLATRELEASAHVADKIYFCTTCGYCHVKCPLGLEIDKIIEAARYELVKVGIAPPIAHKNVASKIEEEDNPFGEPRNERVKWLELGNGSFPEKAEVLYWAGCMASYRTQETAIATVKILQNAGVDFTMLGTEEGCCGSVLLRTGQRELVEEKYARANVEKISAKGVKTLVTACAGCYRTFHEDYREILGNLPFKVLHISEYLERLIKDGKVKFKKELPMKVTYHDPCHLGRHAGIYEPPRNVINAIPGLTLIEMTKNREESRCCGAGGGLRSAYQKQSVKIAADRLELDALPTGAEVLITPCPFCVLSFKDAMSTFQMKIEILDLVELVCKALLF